MGFPGGSDDKESACLEGTRVWSLGWEDLLDKGMDNPLWFFLPGESHGQRSLVACSPWGCKESDVTEWLTHTQPTRRTHVNLIPLYTTLWSPPECYLTTPWYHIIITSFFMVRALKIQFLSSSKFYCAILSSLITMLYIKIYFSLEVYILWPSSPNFFHPSPF